jgi:hypothetical protein
MEGFGMRKNVTVLFLVLAFVAVGAVFTNTAFAAPIFTDTSGSADGWTVAVRSLEHVEGEAPEGPEITIGMFLPPSTTAATPITYRQNWIANNLDGTNGGLGHWTLFTFQQSFSLTGYDPATALLSFRWAADDSGESHDTRGRWTPKFRLNNGDLQEYPGPTTETYYLSSLVTLTGLTGGFVAGTNTITFYVEGNGQTDGLCVVESSLNAVPTTVPGPATILLLSPGLMGLAWMRRKFKK